MTIVCIAQDEWFPVPGVRYDEEAAEYLREYEVPAPVLERYQAALVEFALATKDLFPHLQKDLKGYENYVPYWVLDILGET